MAALGAFQSLEGTVTEYIYLTENGLNQLGFETGPSGFMGVIDDLSVREVGIVTLVTRPALQISAPISVTLAPQLNITATTVNALFGQYHNTTGTFVEYFLLPISGYSQFGIETGPSGFIGSVDDFSVQEVGILTLVFHPGLVIVGAYSQTFTTNCNVSPKFNLSVNAAASGGVVSNLNLTQAYLLAIDAMFSQSIMTEASIASSVNVLLANFRPVKLKWIDWRFPSVTLGPREIGGFQP